MVAADRQAHLVCVDLHVYQVQDYVDLPIVGWDLFSVHVVYDLQVDLYLQVGPGLLESSHLQVDFDIQVDPGLQVGSHHQAHLQMDYQHHLLNLLIHGYFQVPPGLKDAWSHYQMGFHPGHQTGSDFQLDFVLGFHYQVHPDLEYGWSDLQIDFDTGNVKRMVGFMYY